jgi:hypothetical protein
MTRHAMITAEDENRIRLVLYNPGKPTREEYRTRAGAILTLHYWGAKSPTKTVDLAITEGPQRVSL